MHTFTHTHLQTHKSRLWIHVYVLSHIWNLFRPFPCQFILALLITILVYFSSFYCSTVLWQWLLLILVHLFQLRRIYDVHLCNVENHGKRFPHAFLVLHCVCVFVFMCMCVCMCLCACICARLCVCLCVSIFVSMNMCAYVCMYMGGLYVDVECIEAEYIW